MSSGVKPDDNCLKVYDELKLGKKLKYIIYGLSPDMKSITVIKKVDVTSDEGKEYESFVADLPEKECRWGVYDMEYDLGEGKRNKLCFIMWTPDDAPIKQKMVYASSKDALRRNLVGIAAELQGTDYSEVSKEAMMEKVTRR